MLGMGKDLLRKHIDDNFEGVQSAFALHAGVSNASLSSWLSGKSIPDVPSALVLQRVAGVPVEAWDRTDGRRHEPATKAS